MPRPSSHRGGADGESGKGKAISMILGALALLLLASQRPVIPDFWSAPVTLRNAVNGNYFAPIHAALLPDGRIMLLGWQRASTSTDPNQSITRFFGILTPTVVSELPPAEVALAPETVPLDWMDYFDGIWLLSDSLFCAGHNLLTDGRFFVVGGTRWVLNTMAGRLWRLGLPYAITFDGSTWTRVPQDMKGSGLFGNFRYYPTATRLPDSRVLVMGGSDVDQYWENFGGEGGPTLVQKELPNLSAEIFDPATQTWDLISAMGSTPPEIWSRDYTHTFQLPRGLLGETHDLLVFGQEGLPILLSPTSPASWIVRSKKRGGSLASKVQQLASSALLPLRLTEGEWGYSNGSVLVAGGGPGSPAEGHLSSIDIYDPVQDRWTARFSMEAPRQHPATVLLPDGNVVALTGTNDEDDPETGRVEYFDPVAGTMSIGADTMTEMRGYHTVALLLPDGRVLVGGGQNLGAPNLEKVTFRYYYPWYMFQPGRPSLVIAPPEIHYQEGFVIAWEGRPVSEAVLIGLGSMTHSFDANQRNVQIGIAWQQDHWAVLQGPRDSRLAPPGHYLLFVLDENRVPSTGAIVHLTTE